MDQRAARAGADLALVEREHREAFERLVEEIVILGHHIGEEDVRRLAAQFQRHRNEVLAGILHDQAAGRGFAGEGDLGDARAGGERLAGFEAEAVDDVEHAGRQEIADQFGPDQDRGRRLLGRLQDDAVAGGKRRCKLPDRHQDREVPGDDLADDAERLMEVIGDGVVVDLADPAFLGADRGGEIAEMVDGKRHVGRHGFADRLAVVPGFGLGQKLEIVFHRLCDLDEDDGAFGSARAAPGFLGGMGGIERRSISAASERAISQRTCRSPGRCCQNSGRPSVHEICRR